MIFVYCEAQENKMALTVAKQQRPNPADNDDDDADRSLHLSMIRTSKKHSNNNYYQQNLFSCDTVNEDRCPHYKLQASARTKSQPLNLQSRDVGR